jgi:hypothetical protein
MAIVKKRLKLDRSLYAILQILSVTLYVKTHILEALLRPDYEEPEDDACKQLNLFQ